VTFAFGVRTTTLTRPTSTPVSEAFAVLPSELAVKETSSAWSTALSPA
jgi:hypothetical protein